MARRRNSRAKSLRDLRRRPPKRDPYPSLLIVCEGSKTEPAYLEEIRARYELNSANVVVAHGGRTDPGGIVEVAIERAIVDAKRGLPYDEVYVVFDQDTHPSFDQALARVRHPPRALRGKLRAVTSRPCFEYWLLLHFGYSAKPYQPTGSRSPCADLIRDLEQHVPDYEKGASDLFARLADRLEAAKANAEKRLVDARATNSRNPSTEMHRLVDRLQRLKRP